MLDTFTSTGAKFFEHQQVMSNLRDGKGRPVVTHVMLTDVCNHKCAFCSVQHRAGDSLPFAVVTKYLDTLRKYGLKAVILSGGGNPILYKCKDSGADFNNVVDAIHQRGLEIGLITNGMPLKNYEQDFKDGRWLRRSWKTVSLETLDKLTWVRVSMSGLDHAEQQVYVPEVDPEKTTLGFSYVAHDIWDTPEDKAHGKVSTPEDVMKLGSLRGRKVQRFIDRIDKLTNDIGYYVKVYQPKYVRLLPNCLQPALIPHRCSQLQEMADTINKVVGAQVAFVQNKPPQAPRACYLGYIHPVLNCDGYVYPCDSCVLNESADHQFANPWRICRWDEIERIYEEPARSLIKNPAQTCPGCVFTKSNELLTQVAWKEAPIQPALGNVEHVNFV